MATDEVPNVAEISQLLDQCNPEELNNILKSIELGSTPAAVMAPVPPAAPPPSNGRRPAPTNVARAQAESGQQLVAMDEIKQLLAQHSAGVMEEVRKMIPSISSGVMDTIDIATLTQALSERDQEVKALEEQLAGLEQDVASKEKRAAELTNELDGTLREVRHKQLDLEFQQLKLEERVRSNADLEQAQRMLAQKVEEANLQARHAAIDADAGRYTPRSMRAQGSLPWTLRKNRLPAVGL
eukprot:TRINITY_DN65767_c0_g1_i1.p1 TRINITY_DN65767_c0_g1~~TRINITY_DN65767_c0_g1_i1.p1  ORF type:complete len:240 (+),score=67.42 TRINITY_DN65767_c0_g1_i1:63-782(+)